MPDCEQTCQAATWLKYLVNPDGGHRRQTRVFRSSSGDTLSAGLTSVSQVDHTQRTCLHLDVWHLLVCVRIAPHSVNTRLRAQALLHRPGLPGTLAQVRAEEAAWSRAQLQDTAADHLAFMAALAQLRADAMAVSHDVDLILHDVQPPVDQAKQSDSPVLGLLRPSTTGSKLSLQSINFVLASTGAASGATRTATPSPELLEARSAIKQAKAQQRKAEAGLGQLQEDNCRLEAFAKGKEEECGQLQAQLAGYKSARRAQRRRDSEARALSLDWKTGHWSARAGTQDRGVPQIPEHGEFEDRAAGIARGIKALQVHSV